MDYVSPVSEYLKSVIPFKVQMPEPPPLTPEWLSVNGFHPIIVEDWNVHADVKFISSDIVMVEDGVHRNQFVVVMTPMQYTDGEIWFDTAIWMQDNIGCGFCEVLDCNITEWTAERFEMLYFALRGYHPKNHPA